MCASLFIFRPITKKNCVCLILDEGEYMSFGLSPDPQRTMMIGADVAVSWIDKNTGKGYAEDYYLDAKSQCSGNRGSCPDTRLAVSDNSSQFMHHSLKYCVLFLRINQTLSEY